MNDLDERAQKREALQWLARSLAWEDRLAALRDGTTPVRQPLAA